MAHERRKRGRHRGASGKANSDLMTHVASLGLETVRAYQDWCRENGFSGALVKGWQVRREERTLARKLSKQSVDDKAFQHHLKQLGLLSEVEYQDWCRARGLGDSTHKSPQQRKKEIEFHVQILSKAALARSRKQSRRPRDTIERMFAGEINPGSLRTPYLRKAQDTLESLGANKRNRDAYRHLLLQAEQRSDLLNVKPALVRLGPQDGNTYVEALAALARWQDAWVRPLDAWRPETRNSRRQFSSLARHLLADYPVPTFMDAAWFQTDCETTRRQQAWFQHVGAGQNIRTADVPVSLTKKMAHLCLEAPDGYTIEEALRHGQILGMGGDERLVRAVNATRLGQSFECEAFWQTVIRFFVNNPMLDTEHVGPIVDYVYNRKYVPEEITQPGGLMERRPPRQPSFAMKGRSATKLVRQVEIWHRRLARDNRLPNREWAPSGIKAFEATEKGRGSDTPALWRIKELLSTKELVAEGRAMHHCVGSYSGNCQKGNTSIWSMQVTDGTMNSQRVMTIAVNNKSRTVSQARGRYNALPSGRTPNGKTKAFDRSYAAHLRQTRKILYLWREQEGLAMGGYV
jgi:hypothetical protein